jgi:hypothetical protein
VTRILITGSRDWTDRETIARALSDAIRSYHQHNPLTLVHGACPTGADKIADELWRSWMFRCDLAEPDMHEADWATHGKAAGPIRNAHMVSLGADICLAFPLGVSRGTRNCMRLAREAGIPVVEYGRNT